ncbi:hypothetical protein BRADI_3g40736v3 [Brachypodium distachyon]|uniref:BTB domain-containing protein n=2 Tax=Brachypodium distachyon TaxID=15368 RepID=A0A2K2D2E0_BRADI|nr:hypothetical protein BRADI_3g40736v3 [Brachypodium distachyon]
MLDSIFTEFRFDCTAGATKNIHNGRPVSKEIATADYTPRIECCPHGHADGTGEYVSLSLHLTSRRKLAYAALAAFALSAGPRSMEFHLSSGADAASAVWHSFLRRSDVKSRDGTVTLVCGAIVLRAGADADAGVPASDIGEHLGRLLDIDNNNNGSNVSFLVGGETFHAHRAVLAARSPVFKASLLGGMAESTMPCITIKEISPAVFAALLRFIYTDALPPGIGDHELLRGLLAAADRYAMGRLKAMCVQELCGSLSTATVADTLVIAELHHCQELKARCLEFFLVEGNFMEAALTDGYVRLMQEFPGIMDELREYKAEYDSIGPLF